MKPYKGYLDELYCLTLKSALLDHDLVLAAKLFLFCSKSMFGVNFSDINKYSNLASNLILSDHT